MVKPKETREIFNKDALGEQAKEDFDFVEERVLELKKTRDDVYGLNLEELWREADRDYVPHRLQTKGKRVIATDESKGWRGVMTVLGKEDDWMTDISQPNPYVKIQTALGILFDRNPEGVFTPGSSAYEATNLLMKQIHQRNWEIAKSKQQLKLFVFNLSKYGWAIGRTYPLKISRKVRVLVEYNEDEPEKSVWEEKEVVEYNDVFRENLDVFNAWIDDMAKPNSPFSMRDWAWRKVYAFDVAKEEFAKYPLWKFVKPGGVTQERLGGGKIKRYQEKDLVEIYFYENRIRDLFVVIANGVPIIIDPLPISDSQGNKKLSCWQTLWTFRHAESPYGIGIYEAIRNDHNLLDRIRDMTIDQLTLSIYKMGFYSGTSTLTETGTIKIAPGVLKQVLNPKDIVWMQVPGPGLEAWKGIEMLRGDLDSSSGIPPTLAGEIVGKTAFETAQAKEAALKRLKIPLDNVCEALELDGYISVSLYQLLYSIPEVIKISDPDKIAGYLAEIEKYPYAKELYEESFNEEGERKFSAKIYRELQLGLEADEQGNLIESPNVRFFRVAPSGLKWEGIIRIKPQSLLSPSKYLDRALDLEMLNITTPLLSNVSAEMGAAKQMGVSLELDDTTYGKTIKNAFKLYDKDPKDWMPNSWFKKTERPAPTGGPLFTPRGITPPAETITPPAPEAEKLVPTTGLETSPKSVSGKIVGGLTRLFKKI